MKLNTVLATIAVLALAVPATAQTAVKVETKSGKAVWDVTNLEAGQGTNNGGKGKTDKASKGLVNAVTKGGLKLN